MLMACPLVSRTRNPLLDTRVYEVEFTDGAVAEYTANLIAESLYAQGDDHGNAFIAMREIVDHKSNASTIKIDDECDNGWIGG
jgi:hypothetical protein